MVSGETVSRERGKEREREREGKREREVNRHSTERPKGEGENIWPIDTVVRGGDKARLWNVRHLFRWRTTDYE